VGHDGTDYVFNSAGATPKEIAVSVGGTDVWNVPGSGICVPGVTTTVDTQVLTSGTEGNANYAFVPDNTLSNRGLSWNEAYFIQAQGAATVTYIEGNNIAFTGGDGDHTQTTPRNGGGEGVILIHKTDSLTGGNGPGILNAYVRDSGPDGFVAETSSNGLSLMNAGEKRAVITLTTNVTTATVTDTADLTWVMVDANEISNSTSGRLTTSDDCFVGFTVTAEWASNSTGYRRVSIMRRTAGPTYTELNSVSVMAVNGDVTAQNVYFFGSITGTTDELTVRVEQTSGGDLSVNLSASFVRYTTNET
jgi:hypothetical protein